MIRKIKEMQFALKFRNSLKQATDKMLVQMQIEIKKELEKRQKEYQKLKNKR